MRPTEWWWRLPSALAAVGTCVLVAVCARRVAGHRAGLLAGCFLAVLPLFAFYSADARPYTLGALAVSAAWTLWTRRGTPRRPLLHATAVAALLVTAAWFQLFTVLVWPAFLLIGGRRNMRPAMVTLSAATAGVAPLLLIALGQSSEIGWVPPATFPNTLRVAMHVGGGIAVLLLLLVLAGLAVRTRVVSRGPVTYAVTWWTCAPITILAALDVIRPVLVARYALVSLPLVAVAFGVVAGRVVHGRGGLVIRIAGVATLAAAVVTSTIQATRPWKDENYRGAAAYAAVAVSPQTPVLFAPSSARLGFDVYAQPGRLRDLALPQGVGTDPLAIAELAPPLLRELVGGQCRLVLVGDPLTAGAARSTADQTKVGLLSGWTVDSARGFGQVTVSLLTNPAYGLRTSGRN